MRIIVKIVHCQTFTIEVEPTDTIGSVKAKIHETFDIKLEQQRLLFDGRNLEDGRTVTDFNIQEGSILHLLFRLTREQLLKFELVWSLDGRKFEN